MKALLANVDYRTHMTDEGNQLQEGLAHSGWTLFGRGFLEVTDCVEIINRFNPQIVIVHDKRDWDPLQYWAFRRDLGFENLKSIANAPSRIGVVKDAGSMVDYHDWFLQDIQASGVITYYHDQSVLEQSKFLEKYPRYRTFHSIDSSFIRAKCNDYTTSRLGSIVSGAMGAVYPLRQRVAENSGQLGVTVLPHPGYNNYGVRTTGYLETISQFKVHIATASRFHFALRKIIESVAVGCVPITNLPAYDVLPEIDGALVRVEDNISMKDLKHIIDDNVYHWDPDLRLYWAEKCLKYYDYKAIGRRLDRMIMEGVDTQHANYIQFNRVQGGPSTSL